MSDILTVYEPVIGLESHVELRTKSKMFCACSADHFAKKPNTQCCPVCLGLPGALPTPNKVAIEWCIKLGLALNCSINKRSYFDRKNYSYPDLAKGYQISQNDVPFCENGWIDIELPSFEKKRVRIRRIHLEEDTAKLIHSQAQNDNFSKIDFNRSGVPLIEIVTEADIHSPIEAKLYLTKLRDIARYLGISTTDMDKGAMRMEPNISLRRRGEAGFPPYKIEIKNINSFRFVENAIGFEIERQAKILDDGNVPPQETRGWNSDKSITFRQRLKENASDYGYFPEPDLTPIVFSEDEIEEMRKSLPISQDNRIAFWKKTFEIAPSYSKIFMKNHEIATIFEDILLTASNNKLQPEQVVSALVNKRITTWLLDEVVLNESAKRIKNEKTRVLNMVQKLYSFDDVDKQIVSEAITKVLSDLNNVKAIDSYKSGKTQVIGFFIGQVTTKIGKKIDARVIKVLLEKQLSG